MCMAVSELAGTITRLPSLLLYEESRFPPSLPWPSSPTRPRLPSRPGSHPVSAGIWSDVMFPTFRATSLRASAMLDNHSMAHRLGLFACVLLFAAMPRATLAQDGSGASQIRYIEELKQRNAGYGPGCDGIGISVPADVDMPADITSRWAAGHSACVPGMRLIMTCMGEVTGEDRVIGCTLQVADSERDGIITCDQLTLIAPEARFTPDAMLSDALGEASEGGSRSCSEPMQLIPGATVAAVFLVPASASTGDLAVTIDVDGSEVPAFLIPAGQLSADLPPES
jgi:hypothetical protein